MISIIYRLTEHVSLGTRPYWYRKDKCLKSFLKALEVATNVVDRVIFVHDGPGDTLLNQIPKKFDLVKINACDNLKSYHTVLGIADNLDSNLYFVEDDYLHKSESIISLDSVLPTLKYASTYNHPENSKEKWNFFNFPPIEQTSFKSAFNNTWNPTGFCCYTYGIENSVYKKVSSMLKTMGTYDIGVCLEMHKLGYPLWTSTPALSMQVDSYLNDISWKDLNDSIITD
jgi:hypothetical protein